MSITKRRQIRRKQRLRRRERRQKLKSKGMDLENFYYGKYYIGRSKSQ